MALKFAVLCPGLALINERRHRLHEVVRLSGINVSVDNDDYPLADQSGFSSQCKVTGLFPGQ